MGGRHGGWEADMGDGRQTWDNHPQLLSMFTWILQNSWKERPCFSKVGGENQLPKLVVYPPYLDVALMAPCSPIHHTHRLHWVSITSVWSIPSGKLKDSCCPGCQGVGIRTLMHWCWVCKLVCTLWKWLWRVFKILKIELPLLDICSHESL